MGAWGYKTFENDNACDWLNTYENFLIKGIKNACYDTNIASIAILVSSNIEMTYGFEILDLAFSRIEKILKDKDWLNEWQDKTIKIKEINDLKDGLNILRNKLLSKQIAH